MPSMLQTAASLLAATLMALLPGPASSSECNTEQDALHRRAFEAWLGEVEADLALRADADSKAVAALLGQMQHSLEVSELAREGKAEAEAEVDLAAGIERVAEGGRAAFNALWAQRDAAPIALLYPLFLRHEPHLDADSALRWRGYLVQRMHPQFAAFALEVRGLEAAGAPPEDIDAVLEAAARHGVVGPDHYYESARILARAMLRVPMGLEVRAGSESCVAEAPQAVEPLSQEAAVYSVTMGYTMAMIDPGFPASSCREAEEPLSERRLSACRTVSRRLALEGNTLLDRSVGLSVWRRLGIDEIDAPVARATWRQLRWWQEAGAARAFIVAEGQSEAELLHQRARDVMQPGVSELDILNQALNEAGLETSPPEAWSPVQLEPF